MLTRLAATGLIFCLFISFSSGNFVQIPMLWLMFILFGIVFTILFWSIGLFTQFGKIFTAIGYLYLCIGDPIVYLINRVFPNFLKIKEYEIFNHAPIFTIDK